MKKMNPYQHTLKREVSFCGIGLHSGEPVNLSIKPAPADSGIRFVRSDLGREMHIPAFMNKVIDTNLATTIAEDEASVSTTEHLMAALFGMGIDNAVIELDAPEVPIMDGSAGPFVHVLNKVERQRQQSYRKMLKITKELTFQSGDKSITILPYNGTKVTCAIDFNHALIKQQSYTIDLTPKRFRKEIASARTFGFMEEVKMLKDNGFALGGSLDNAVVIDGDGVINKDGLRFADEFVRHKVLDLIGDLALLGCHLLGHVIATKSGHSQHLGFMKEIVAHPECWEVVSFEKMGEDTVFKKVVTSTMAAGSMFLPFLIPPAEALVSLGHHRVVTESCAVA